jgi:hypothetical protein
MEFSLPSKVTFPCNSEALAPWSLRGLQTCWEEVRCLFVLWKLQGLL